MTLPWWTVPLIVLFAAYLLVREAGQGLGVSLVILGAGVIAALSFIAGRMTL